MHLPVCISDAVSNFAADVNGEEKKKALAPTSQGKKAQLDCYPMPGHQRNKSNYKGQKDHPMPC